MPRVQHIKSCININKILVLVEDRKDNYIEMTIIVSLLITTRSISPPAAEA